MPFQSTLVQTMDEEKAEIVADYRATCERAKRFAEERLALHKAKRSQILSMFAAAIAVAATGPNTKNAA